jgi:hypothetical protein
MSPDVEPIEKVIAFLGIMMPAIADVILNPEDNKQCR